MKPINALNENFFHRVYEVVKSIPPGRVTSYGAIAQYLSAPGAARMVGWALNKINWFESGIPAHRVVNRNGLLTGKMHFPGEHTMADLLRSEGIEVVNNQVVDFEKVFFRPKPPLD